MRNNSIYRISFYPPYFFLAQYKCFVDICDKQTIPVTYKVTEE